MELKSRWTVPLKISYTIIWLAIVSMGVNPHPH